MLEDIRLRAKIVVAVYDKKQVLSKTQVWENDSFEKLEESIGKDNIIHLRNQMRIDAEDQTIEWLNNVIKKNVIGKIPEDSKYEIKVFRKPQDMQEAIQEKNADQNNGISRMVATYDWEYSSQSKPKDGSNTGRYKKAIGRCLGIIKLTSHVRLRMALATKTFHGQNSQ